MTARLAAVSSGRGHRTRAVASALEGVALWRERRKNETLRKANEALKDEVEDMRRKLDEVTE